MRWVEFVHVACADRRNVTSTCATIQASSSEQSQHQSSSSSGTTAPPPVGYANPSTNSNVSHNHHFHQEQNTQMGNSRNNSNNLRNSMVATHQPHQSYAPNGNVLVNGGNEPRQLQGGRSSSGAPGTGSGPSQSGQSSQVPGINHQPQKEDNFDVSVHLCPFSVSLSFSFSHTHTPLSHLPLSPSPLSCSLPLSLSLSYSLQFLLVYMCNVIHVPHTWCLV